MVMGTRPLVIKTYNYIVNIINIIYHISLILFKCNFYPFLRIISFFRKQELDYSLTGNSSSEPLSFFKFFNASIATDIYLLLSIHQ